MTPGIYPLALYKGDTKRFTVILKSGPEGSETPIDLTGCTARAQVRATASGSLMASFTCSLTGTPTDGKINLVLPPSQSVNLVGSTAVWDLEVIRANGDVETYLQGAVSISDDVTE